jgi:membrane-associated phospholipid phosphatase
MLAQTLIYSGTILIGAKIVSGRSRPSLDEGSGQFHFWQIDDARQSFPSGHTVVAFSVATVLAERIDHWAASALLYTGAAAVGIGRSYQDHHWASDVLVGAVLGYTAGIFVQAQEARRQGAGQDESRLSLLPTGNGLSLVIRL